MGPNTDKENAPWARRAIPLYSQPTGIISLDRDRAVPAGDGDANDAGQMKNDLDPQPVPVPTTPTTPDIPTLEIRFNLPTNKKSTKPWKVPRGLRDLNDESQKRRIAEYQKKRKEEEKRRKKNETGPLAEREEEDEGKEEDTEENDHPVPASLEPGNGNSENANQVQNGNNGANNSGSPDNETDESVG